MKRISLPALVFATRPASARSWSFGQISRVLQRIHTDCARRYDMESLAREAGMSVSTFHLHFNTVTSRSPLQYVKNVRLH